MASGSELPEYSSSVKRRKIEGQVYGVSVPSDLDFSETKQTRQSSRTDLEGIYPKICFIFINKY